MWYGGWIDVTELDVVEMLQSANTQWDGVSYSLVERCIRASPEQIGLVPVLHEVLDVSHLMVNGLEVFRIHLRTHFDPALRALTITQLTNCYNHGIKLN